jgi:hypothetical protein
MRRKRHSISFEISNKNVFSPATSVLDLKKSNQIQNIQRLVFLLKTFFDQLFDLDLP